MGGEDPACGAVLVQAAATSANKPIAFAAVIVKAHYSLLLKRALTLTR
jgi:hypothetical protein